MQAHNVYLLIFIVNRI